MSGRARMSRHRDGRWSRGTRAGFTLLETVLALTLVAIVLTLAATALSAATGARAAVARHAETTALEARVRSALVDMLRHPPRADAVDEPLLRVERDGGGGARLVFLSQGVVQPFGTGPVWRVTLDGAPTLSVRMEPARSTPSDEGPVLHTALPHLHRLDVAVLESGAPDGGSAWRFDWPVARSRPALVRLAWRDSAGAASVPLVVALDGAMDRRP